MSRPGSSRPVSRVSTPGPSEHLLDILERLGKLDSDHQALKARVDALEVNSVTLDFFFKQTIFVKLSVITQTFKL